MAFPKDTTFTDAVTIVYADWLNLMQAHIAGLVSLEVDTPTATQFRIKGGNDDAVASIYIEGQQRFRDTNASFNFTSEPSGTYQVYVTAPSGVDSFEIEITQGTPVVSPYRQIGEIVWNGAAIASYRIENSDHVHTLADGSGEVAHADHGGLTGSAVHTQYSLPDGSRPFTGAVGGIDPTLDAHIATKDYIDGIATPSLPVGAIVPFAGDAADVPGGWVLCDGASLATGVYTDLFGVIGYAFGGSGGSFNVPDLQSRYALGVAASGTGSSLGETGGAEDHTHTQPTHTHTGVAHTHGSASHTHSFPTTGNSSAEHSHTQGATGSNSTHAHTGPSHSHSGSSLTVGGTGSASVGAENGSTTTVGLFSKATVDTVSNETSHTHSAGSYTHSTLGALSGTSSSASASHYHYASGSSYTGHTHTMGSVSGTTDSGGTQTTGNNSVSHTHTNPSSSTSSAHTHSGGTSGSSSPSFNSGGGGATDAGGGQATGTEQPPFVTMNYIIRRD